MFPNRRFFGQLNEKFNKNNWKAKAVHQLQRIIRKLSEEIDPNGAQTTCASILTKLQTVADCGPFDIVH